MKPAEAKTKPSPSPFPPVAAAATLDRTVDALILTILAATATYFVMGTAKYMFFAILVIGTAKVVNSKKNEFELKMVNYVPPSAGVIDVEFEEVVEEVKEEVLEEVSEEDEQGSSSSSSSSLGAREEEEEERGEAAKRATGIEAFLRSGIFSCSSSCSSRSSSLSEAGGVCLSYGWRGGGASLLGLGCR